MLTDLAYHLGSSTSTASLSTSTKGSRNILLEIGKLFIGQALTISLQLCRRSLTEITPPESAVLLGRNSTLGRQAVAGKNNAMTSHYFIRVGAMGQIGRFRRAADKNLPPLTLPSPPLFRCAGGGEGTLESAARLTVVDTIEYRRHHRVIVRTCRGLETGEVLAPAETATSRFQTSGPFSRDFDPKQVDGQILRGMTPQDQLLEARLEIRRQSAYAACVQLMEQRKLVDLLIDVEHLFDGQGLYFYFLGEVTPELENITSQLAETYEAKVQFRKFTETLLAGCGPDCGSEAVAGQGGCESCTHCEVAVACKEARGAS